MPASDRTPLTELNEFFPPLAKRDREPLTIQETSPGRWAYSTRSGSGGGYTSRAAAEAAIAAAMKDAP